MVADAKQIALVAAGIFLAGALLHLLQDTSAARYISRGLAG